MPHISESFVNIQAVGYSFMYNIRKKTVGNHIRSNIFSRNKTERKIVAKIKEILVELEIVRRMEKQTSKYIFYIQLKDSST